MNLGENDINFKGSNPGAVKYGNFINYYQFHPANDRIKVLPSTIWNKNKEKYICLDIGCNAGDLTIALYDYFSQNVCSKVNILGIDIDSTLIRRSQENINDKCISFQCLDIMNECQRTIISNHLSACNQTVYDVIFCFSTTMWIHLNHGDDGLKRFLYYICSISKMIIIEPQPWKCYRTAVKRLKLVNHEFPYFKKLQIRSDVDNVIKKVILDNNFEEIHESDSTKWGRKILIFTKPNIN